MASVRSIVTLRVEPLTTIDASGLTSTILPKVLIQPSMVVRTDPDTAVSLIPVAAVNDVWRVDFSVPSDMPDYTFLPISLLGSFVGTTFTSDFWNVNAAYAITPPQAREQAFQSFTLGAGRLGFDGAANFIFQSAAPVFQGYPPFPVETGGAAFVIGALSFVCAVFDAATAAATSLFVDARWLAFPRATTQNAAYYMPRLGFNPS